MDTSNIATLKSATDVEPSYRGLIVGLAGLFLLQVLGVAVWQRWFRHEAALPEQAQQNVILRMGEYVRERRYDDAVQAGLSSLKGEPGDDVVLQQIAVVYLRRAQIEGEPERWAPQAADYAEKALAAHPGEEVNLYSSARAFEIAGDFSAARRCEYYARSAILLQERTPLLAGERAMMNGRLSPAGPLRQENEFLLNRVKAKSANSRCT